MTNPGRNSTVELVVANFFHCLLDGKLSSILDSFEGTPNIDSPRAGKVVGREAVQRFLEEEKAWLLKLGASNEGVVDVKKTSSTLRIIQEVGILIPAIPPRPRHHIFAVVADLGSNGIEAIRLYYCYGFLSGNKTFLRAAILPPEPSLFSTLPPMIRSYVDCVTTSDMGVLNLFAEGASVTGVPSIPLKKCTMTKFYSAALAGEGGVPIQLATVTHENQTCVVEENLNSWGDIQFETNTAGLASFDYDEFGLLLAVRIYDDIPDNPFTRPGWIEEKWDGIYKKIIKAGCECAFIPTKELSPAETKVKFLFDG